jgi:sugar/nucleoside kinase (ribokinase family)
MSCIENMIKKWDTSKQVKSLLGFDGFVDTIIHVVDKRYSHKHYDRIQTISAFAERIVSAANLSANLEFVPQKVKLGGNGPIMANALINQNHKVFYIGALGKPAIHPVFNDFVQKCEQVVSLSEPGYTDAVEFSDGKLMFGKLTELQNINWTALMDAYSDEALKNLLSDKELIAFTNWTMLPDLNSIIVEFGKLLANSGLKPFLFFDLADPQKRTKDDILQLLSILSDLNKIAPVILGLNERESATIQSMLHINENEIDLRSVKIRSALHLAYVVIHPVYGAAAASEHEYRWVKGPYTKNPRLTTGAGDHFNAGFCNGLLHNLNLEEALLTGVYTSGFYVREMHSPSISELFEFMKKSEKDKEE